MGRSGANFPLDPRALSGDDSPGWRATGPEYLLHLEPSHTLADIVSLRPQSGPGRRVLPVLQGEETEAQIGSGTCLGHTAAKY